MASRRQRIPFDRWRRARGRRARVGACAGVLAVVALAAWPGGSGPSAWRALDRREGRVVAIGPDAAPAVRLDGEPEPIDIALLGVGVPAGGQPALRSWLEAELLGRRVWLSLDRAAPVDAGGRPLALIYREDGLLVNEYVIDRGLACAGGGRHALSGWFARVEGWARSKGRGRWAPPTGDADEP